MFRKLLVGTIVLLAVASAARAQTPKVEVTGFVGYSLIDGVTGDPIKAGNGKTYDEVYPEDSVSFGFSAGFFVTPKAELGFIWRRQATDLTISGPNGADKLSGVNIDGYHGFGAYYFGDPEGKAQPYIMFGLGMTHYGGIAYTGAGGAAVTGSNSQFSTTWGAGVKVNASPNVGVKLGLQWTPTYIKSDAAGWWCDPWWGCYVVGNAQYSNQLEFLGGVVFRF